MPTGQALFDQARNEPGRRRAEIRQQTLYLPPAVHDQLRELAFAERVKMHALIMARVQNLCRPARLKAQRLAARLCGIMPYRE